ncbi:hypothetical protein [Chryseobacterium sp. M5A1_1a]
MRNTYKYLMPLTVAFSTSFLSSLSGQASSSQKNTVLSNNDLVTSFEGTGFNLGTRRMNFSTFASQSTDRRNGSLKNNGITIGKDGLYQVAVSGNIHENDSFEQKEEYIVYTNEIEVAKGFEIPGAPTGIFSFEKMLKKGDVLSFGSTMNDEQLKKSTGTNVLTIRLVQN